MPKAHDNPDGQGALDDHFDGFEVGPLPPQVTAPPSMPMPAMPLIPQLPTPPMTEDNHWCLRGPCRHLMITKSLANVDNSAAGYLPEQLDRYCMAIPGVFMELGSELVFECTHWDPKQGDAHLEARRRNFLKVHKSCEAADAARKTERETAFAKMQLEADAQRAADLAEFEQSKKNVQEKIDAESWAGTAAPKEE